MMLAATRLIALHKNKGMTVAACLKTVSYTHLTLPTILRV